MQVLKNATIVWNQRSISENLIISLFLIFFVKWREKKKKKDLTKTQQRFTKKLRNVHLHFASILTTIHIQQLQIYCRLIQTR